MKKAKMQTTLTQERVINLLEQECEKVGSTIKWARVHKLSQPLVSMTLAGKRKPAKKILKALGLIRVTLYTRG